jgi:hypothetical protein
MHLILFGQLIYGCALIVDLSCSTTAEYASDRHWVRIIGNNLVDENTQSIVDVFVISNREKMDL